MAGIEQVKFAPGNLIFKEGDKSDGVYFVVRGTVEVSRIEGGAKIVLAKLGPNSVFGEMALIDKLPRSATVLALENVECMKGTEEGFAGVLNNTDPEVKVAMQKLVSVVREKNKTKKAQMTNSDLLLAEAVKQKAAKTRQDIITNQALVEKIKKIDPFVNGVINSLLKIAGAA